MLQRKKDTARTQETPLVEDNPMVRARLRTLLQLAITIGRREGLLGNNGDQNFKEVQNVPNKRSI